VKLRGALVTFEDYYFTTRNPDSSVLTRDIEMCIHVSVYP
jgi:hypothetical protein